MIILICAIKDILILLDKCILEPIVSKGTRWVLRRGKGSNLLVLSDNYLQSPLVDSDISNLNIVDLKEILSKISCDGENLLEVLTNELNSFQSKLKPAGFDFGFRVINEILRFMVVAWRYENSPDNWDNWQRYFDAQIKQKILPKLHGSQKAIGNVLNDLFNLCLVNSENNEQARLFEVSENNCKYYTSALKLQNMAKVLSDQRYVSFIN